MWNPSLGPVRWILALVLLVLIAVPWRPALAGGQAGSAGVPRLNTSAPLVGGTLILTLSQGNPGATSFLAFGLQSGTTDLDGIGTLDLGPDFQVLGVATTDSAGRATFRIPVPAAQDLCGTTARFQACVFDASAPNGVAISSAVQLTLRASRLVVVNHGVSPGPGDPGAFGSLTIGEPDGPAFSQVPLNTFPERVCIRSDGKMAFETGRYGMTGRVHVIDLDAGGVCATLTMDANPLDVALSGDSQRLHVLTRPVVGQPTHLHVFDAHALHGLATFELDPAAYRLLAAGPRRMVVLQRNLHVTVIDAADRPARGPFRVGRERENELFDAHFAAAGGRFLHVLTGQPRPFFPVPPPPEPGTLQTLDLETGRVTAWLSVGQVPIVLAESSNDVPTTRLATLNVLSRDISVVNAEAWQVARTLPVPTFTAPWNEDDGPSHLEAVPGQPWVVTLIPGRAPTSSSSGRAGMLVVQRLDTGEQLRSIRLAVDRQRDLALDPITGDAFVLNETTRTMTRYDVSTGERVGAPVSTGNSPRQIVIR